MQEKTEFEELVIRDSHGQVNEEESQYLRTTCLDDWVHALTTLVMDMDSQFASSKARVAQAKSSSLDNGSKEFYKTFRGIEAAELEWRQRAARYKAGLVARLTEAKRLQKARNL